MSGVATPGDPGTTVSDLGEHRLIERIRARVPTPPAWVQVGLGDDAAVIEPGRNAVTVVTVDALVEGVHFDLGFSDPADVGFKALAVSLSDLAAMGATPRVAVLSLAFPGHLPLTAFDAVVDGVLEAAARHAVSLVGGNLSRSPGPLVVDVTALGSVGRRRVLTRSGARPGDELYVSGTVGAAATGLDVMRTRAASAADDPALRAALERCRRPAPRVRLGQLIGKNRAANACIDLSDGFADAVHQLAAASGVGARVDGSALPIDPGTTRWCQQRGTDPIEVALRGGEDYELLVAVPRKLRRRFLALGRLTQGVPLTPVGVVTAETDVLLQRDGRTLPLPNGFVHF